MKKHHYSLEVDPHIYIADGKGGCKTRQDWIDLALAALDQAGFKHGKKQLIEDIIEAVR